MGLPHAMATGTFLFHGAGVYGTKCDVSWEGGEIDVTPANPGSKGMGAIPDPAKKRCRITIEEIDQATATDAVMQQCRQYAVVDTIIMSDLSAADISDMNAVGPFWVQSVDKTRGKGAETLNRIVIVSSGGAVAGTTTVAAAVSGG